MRGHFARGGTIIWTSDTGSPIGSQFTIQGEALRAIDPDPELLSFTAAEIESGLNKELVFTSKAPLDWSTFALSTSDSAFQLTSCIVAENTARCKVKCVLVHGLESVDGLIGARANLRRQSTQDEPVTVSTTVVVQAKQAANLTIRPQTVSIIHSPTPDRASARLLIRRPVTVFARA
jgi:hypothetical protein